MYPERTWQEDVLSRLNQHIHQPLTLSDITLTPDWYSNTGRIRLSINPAPQSRYYSDDPVSIYLQRRDISKLFIHHQPYVIVANATTVADCLNQLFQKYGLLIDLAIFDQDTLTQSIVFEAQEKTVSIAIRTNASESWYGTFQFVAKKKDPTDDDFPSPGSIPNYGSLLDEFSQMDVIRGLEPGMTVPKDILFELASHLDLFQPEESVEIVENATVVFNGIITDPKAPVSPPYRSHVLVLQPTKNKVWDDILFFSYD